MRTCKPDILRPSVSVVYQAELPAHFPVEQLTRTFNPYRNQTHAKTAWIFCEREIEVPNANWVTSVILQAFEG